MAYVITQGCCSDASCTAVCPVDCIHPTPDEPDFGKTEMLYIDPDMCIDCGACVEACPVAAVSADDELSPAYERYLDINAVYYRRQVDLPMPTRPAPRPAIPKDREPLRVAIVGSGPAACYAAKDLVAHNGVEIEMFERLPTPGGLVRAGVAPDHQHTKSISNLFAETLRRREVRIHFNVAVGSDLSHTELLEHHHAVIYAHGTAHGRRLDIPGADLPGSIAAGAFVYWYNAHPDYGNVSPDLSSKRAVIIGNGNVALDVARVLLVDNDALAISDIAEHAIAALRASNIEEVVVIGRRGPEHAAYSSSELLALTQLPDVDVVIDPPLSADDPFGVDEAAPFKHRLTREVAGNVSEPGRKRIVLKFGATPVAILGGERVTGIRLQSAGTHLDEELTAGLAIHAVGFRGEPIPGVPFDYERGIIPNEAGRVIDANGDPVPGAYVTGWVKRGPSGVIGTNKQCAQQTVGRLVDDFVGGLLDSPRYGAADLDDLLKLRSVNVFGMEGWDAIDAVEVQRGQAIQKVRSKLTDVHDMLAIAISSSA